MDLRENSDERAFRLSARKWLDANLSNHWLDEVRNELIDPDRRLAVQLDWHRRLNSGGWLGLNWPKEYGGRGLPLTYQLIFNEELARREAPGMASWVGLELVGPTLIDFGTDEQKATFLPSILSGDELWCQGFSEPDAGSDLFAIKTTATRTPKGWRLDGRKKWTSWAQYSGHALILARTGAEAEGHRSLSMFIVPMKSAGLTVISTRMIDGDAEENELIFDGVEIEEKALLGALNQGAKIVMRNMSFARGIGTIERTLALEILFGKVWRSARVMPTPEAPAMLRDSIQSRLANLHARIQALKYLGYRKVSEMAESGEPGPIASVEKLVWAETNKALTRLALDIVGPGALIEDRALDDGSWRGQWTKEFFRSMGGAVEGGTNEIQKNTIAKRVLQVYAG